MPLDFINFIKIYDEDGERAVFVAIFENKKGVIKEIHNFFNVDGDNDDYPYSPTGLWFRNRATIIESKDRIFYKQRSFLDY